MKTIVCGSRHIGEYEHIKVAIELSEFNITEIVSASIGSVDSKTLKVTGPDKLAEAWAAVNNIPTRLFDTSMEMIGLSSERYRIEEMVEYADALIAIWDGKSTGTLKTIEAAKDKGLKIFVYMYEKNVNKRD